MMEMLRKMKMTRKDVEGAASCPSRSHSHPLWPTYPSVTGGSSWGKAMCKEKGVCILNIDHEFYSAHPMHCFIETREQILKRYRFILVTAEEKSQKIKLKSQVLAVI